MPTPTTSEHSSLIFGNKYMATAIAAISPKEVDDPFSFESLVAETHLRRGDLNNPVGRLVKLELVYRPSTSYGLQGEMFRRESDLWLPLGALAAVALTQPELSSEA